MNENKGVPVRRIVWAMAANKAAKLALPDGIFIPKDSIDAVTGFSIIKALGGQVPADVEGLDDSMTEADAISLLASVHDAEGLKAFRAKKGERKASKKGTDAKGALVAALVASLTPEQKAEMLGKLLA